MGTKTRKGKEVKIIGYEGEQDSGVVVQTIEHIADAEEKRALKQAKQALKETQKSKDGSDVHKKPGSGYLAPFLKRIKHKR
ncbi:MAG: hypothetical protein JRJ78_14735 [Deltaproteobacteria bacterium]|nr:hypothetical protein [Deltaproteobacteria bacterium]